MEASFLIFPTFGSMISQSNTHLRVNEIGNLTTTLTIAATIMAQIWQNEVTSFPILRGPTESHNIFIYI